ncbi:hypothetical protein ACF0H5_009453 [Mactra antiquata]
MDECITRYFSRGYAYRDVLAIVRLRTGNDLSQSIFINTLTMTNMDRLMPSWMYKWMIINAFILIIDGGFCVLRPHSLPDGCLGSNIYYPYRLYVEADKHYADPTDSFIFTQGFGNLVEAVINIMIVLNVFKTVRLSKIVTMCVSVMTAYKTFLFCLYSFDIGQGGRPLSTLFNEFLVFGLGSVWLFVPIYIVWVLLPDFLNEQQIPSCSLQSKTDNTSYSLDDSFKENIQYKIPPIRGDSSKRERPLTEDDYSDEVDSVPMKTPQRRSMRLRSRQT